MHHTYSTCTIVLSAQTQAERNFMKLSSHGIRWVKQSHGLEWTQRNSRFMHLERLADESANLFLGPHNSTGHNMYPPSHYIPPTIKDIETHHVTSHNEEYVSKIGNDFGSWDLANFKCSVRFLLLHIPYNALQPPPSDFHMCLGHTWLSALTPRRCIEHKGLWLGDTAVHVLPPLQPRAIKLQSMSVYISILYVYNYVHTI